MTKVTESPVPSVITRNDSLAPIALNELTSAFEDLSPFVLDGLAETLGEPADGYAAPVAPTRPGPSLAEAQPSSPLAVEQEVIDAITGPAGLNATLGKPHAGKFEAPATRRSRGADGALVVGTQVETTGGIEVEPHDDGTATLTATFGKMVHNNGGFEVGRVGYGTVTSEGGHWTYGLTGPAGYIAGVEAGTEPRPTLADPYGLPIGARMSVTAAERDAESSSVGFHVFGAEDTFGATEGIEYTVERLAEHRVRVTRTDISGDDTARTKSVGLLGPLGVDGGSEDAYGLRQSKVFDIDLSTPAGQAAYRAFVETGEMPGEGATLVGHSDAVRQTYTPDLPLLGASGPTRIKEREVVRRADGSVLDTATLEMRNMQSAISTTDDGGTTTGHAELVLQNLHPYRVEQLQFLATGEVPTEQAGADDPRQDVRLTFTDDQLLVLRDRARRRIPDWQSRDLSTDPWLPFAQAEDAEALRLAMYALPTRVQSPEDLIAQGFDPLFFLQGEAPLDFFTLTTTPSQP